MHYVARAPGSGAIIAAARGHCAEGSTMSSSTVERPKRLYDVISERAVTREQLPSGDVLDETVSALAAVDEFLIEPTKTAVAAVGSVGAPGSITFEDIGRLVLWADTVRMHAESLLEAAAMVTVVAYQSFTTAEGFQGDLDALFSETGSIVDRESAEQLARRHGFDA